MEKQILYCYRVDEDTGKLDCYIVDDYKIYSLGAFTDCKNIRFDARLVGLKTKTTYYLKAENIDHYVRGCVFTYEQDYDKAYALVKHTVSEQIDLTKKKLKKLQCLYDKLSKGGNEL